MSVTVCRELLSILRHVDIFAIVAWRPALNSTDKFNKHIHQKLEGRESAWTHFYLLKLQSNSNVAMLLYGLVKSIFF